MPLMAGRRSGHKSNEIIVYPPSFLKTDRRLKVRLPRDDKTPVRVRNAMLAIIGIVIVLGAIAGGYLMEHGKLLVLMQPAELVIIFGAAVGTVIVGNPLPTLMKIVNGLKGVFTGSPFTKAFYLENLKMVYELFTLARKSGTAKLEEDVDNPG